MPRLVSRAALAVAVIALASPAQQPTPDNGPAHPARVVWTPPRPFSVSDALVYRDRVVVKFREGIAVRQIDGELRCAGGVDLEPVRASIRGCRVERLFTRPVDVLDRERAELQAKVPPGEAPLADLNNYYRVWTKGAADTERLVNTLNDEPLIETAYAEFIPVPIEDIPPTTPNFESGQGYLDDAPGGFGYRRIQSIVGARFPDGRLAHLEGAWPLGHEDCDWLQATNYVGLPPTAPYIPNWENHGAGCVGIMAGGRNEYGIRGMGCDTRQLLLISLTNGSANMVDLAAAVLQPGDVMSSSFAYVITPLHAPRDLPQADWDAIRKAATKGIHYTFGAGNSNTELSTPHVFLGRYLASSPSSGGYIVGATMSTAPVKMMFSNYSKTHVISNGWGENVVTMGYGHLFFPYNDPRQAYTNLFGGTSAAGPQLAGVIAAFVGAVKEQTGRVLTVNQVKEALRTTGTPVTGDVGRRPDLVELLGLYGLPDGLLVTADGAPGGTWEYEVTGEVGEPYTVLFSPGRGRVELGVNRPLLLDATSLTVLEGGRMAAGVVRRTWNVPNASWLKGTDWYVQAVFLRDQRLYLSSSAAVWFQ